MGQLGVFDRLEVAFPSEAQVRRPLGCGSVPDVPLDSTKLFPLQDRIMVMTAAIRNDAYTPSQVSAVTGLPLPAVHKAIEYKLIRPKRVCEGHLVQRLLSRSQAIYLRMEAKGLRSLPLAARRQVARAVEQDPGIDAMSISEGGVILIQ